MDLLLEVLPVEYVWQPAETARKIEDDLGELPRPGEGIDEEDIEGEGDEGIVHHIRILEVNSTILNVIAREQEELTITVELESLRWLINLIGSLQILSSTLSQLSLICPDDFVQVLDLAEPSLLLLDEALVLIH